MNDIPFYLIIGCLNVIVGLIIVTAIDKYKESKMYIEQLEKTIETRKKTLDTLEDKLLTTTDAKAVYSIEVEITSLKIHIRDLENILDKRKKK